MSVGESAYPLLAFAALAIPARTKWLRRVCILLALLFTGALTESLHRPAPPPTIDASSKEVMLLEGCVVEPSVFSATREQFTLELDPGARARVSMNVDDDAQLQRLSYGQRVEIEARIRVPHNYNNPGSFDYAHYLARRKISWTAAIARHSPIRIKDGRCGSRFWSAIYALRTAAVDRIEKLYPNDGYSTGMLEAILIGETSKLEKVWTQNFRRTGTYHTLIIAGFHVTILAGCLLFLLRICQLDELPALGITCGAAWLYALVSGFNAPVVRAAGGFTLYAIARFFYRRGRVLNLLGAVALTYLLWDPDQLFDAAFQLTFLSVVAIGALAAPLLNATSIPLAGALKIPAAVEADPHLEPRLAQFRVELRLIADSIQSITRIPARWLLPPIALLLRVLLWAYELAVISAVMQIGLALPMAEYFHRVSFSGLTANLIVSPVMGALVPVGFLAIFTGWHWTAALSSAMLNLSTRVVDWHAHIEPDWRIVDPPLWLALAFVASLAALALSTNRRILRWPALSAVAGFFILLIWQPFGEPKLANILELTAIDVGQGDSLLAVFPGGAKMLIDGGGLLQYGRQHRPSIDIGEDVVAPYLWSRRIRRLDVVVATHAHEDHTGGLAAILEDFRPRELWIGTNPQQALLEQAARLHIRVIARRAEPPFAYSGAMLEILSPPADFAPAKAGNNDSLAFRICFGSRSFLLTGDMEKPMEGRLLSENATLHADVLKVGHHGSKTSTIQPFLDAVAPSVAMISDGFENSFGHPHKDVLARLRDRHTAILRTDLDGLITVQTDGNKLKIDMMEWSRQGSAFGPVWSPDLVQ
jgi:competence protein ComEC